MKLHYKKQIYIVPGLFVIFILLFLNDIITEFYLYVNQRDFT